MVTASGRGQRPRYTPKNVQNRLHSLWGQVLDLVQIVQAVWMIPERVGLLTNITYSLFPQQVIAVIPQSNKLPNYPRFLRGTRFRADLDDVFLQESSRFLV